MKKNQTMTDREKLDKIEGYLLDIERSMSDIIADNARFKVKFEKFDKMEHEIAALRKDFNQLKDNALTYDGFEHLIDAMLARTEEISEIRITTKKHESDIRRVETKVDNLEAKVDNLETKVDNLETKVDNLSHEMRSGFSLIIQEFKNLKK